jgi:hypothetical protein
MSEMIRKAVIAGCLATAFMCGCPSPQSVSGPPASGGAEAQAPPGKGGAPEPAPAVRASSSDRTRNIRRPKFSVTQWRPLSTQGFPLETSTIAVALPASPAPVKIPVVLEYVSYPAEMREAGPAIAAPRKTELTFLRLRSSDATVAYEWWHCPGGPTAMLCILPGDADTAYLAWSYDRYAEFANVSRPRGREEALAQLNGAPFNGTQPGIERIPVLDLTGSKIPFDGLNAQNYDIHVTSVTRSEAGGYEVRLHGIDKTKEFVFISHNGKWSLKESPFPPAAQ